MSVSAPDDAVSIATSPGGTPGPSRTGDTRVHASCVAIQGRGVLLLGASGSGKSDLALRLIDGGGTLVADDQVLVTRRADALVAWPPEGLAGLLEVRGVGILKLPFCAAVPLRLMVELAESCGPRLPPAAFYVLLGIELPCVRLDPTRPSAAAIIRMALCAERFA